MNTEAQAALERLMEGNERFRTGRSQTYTYSREMLEGLAQAQTPLAAIIACADSRVSPDILFDQPLGTIFASRVPGNVASDSAKWMLDIAIEVFHVPLVVVLGHTGCLAIGQLLEGDKGGSGGALRHEALNAVMEAKARRPADLFREAVIQNALQTVRRLEQHSFPLRKAMEERGTAIVPALYEMETGEVKLIAPNSR